MSRSGWFVTLAVLVGCSGSPPTPPTPPADPQPLATDGLHNVYRVSDGLFSGSSPEGDAGFAALKKLGVKTILSVDGAVPEVATAEKHGMRYVHLPIGYDGISRERVFELARAVRDLPGPVYVHCHHGKHRGPAAAAVIQLCLDSWTPEQAANWMRTAGTDPKYTGLTALPNTVRRPTTAELNTASDKFPKVAAVADLTRLMVDVDARWDHLKLVKEAGWTIPKDHPDIDPPHEAVQLAELYREAARLKTTHDAEFTRLLTEAERAANDLATVLRGSDSAAKAAAFTASQAACTRCHAGYRDKSR
jgi:hypothetical protein